MSELVVVCGDGVPGCPRYGSHYVALGSEKSVRQGGFSDIRTPDYGYVGQFRMVVFCSGVGREQSDDFIQKVSGTASCRGRDAEKSVPQPERVELVGVVHLVPCIHLVDGHYHGFVAAPEDVGYLGVIVRNAGLRLHHEEYKICLLYRENDLFADFRLEYIIGIAGVSSRIHDREFMSAPFALAVVPVTGHSGCLVHDGLPHSHEAVEKGGFPHVRSSHDSYKAHNYVFYSGSTNAVLPLSVLIPVEAAGGTVAASQVAACRVPLPVLASP